MTTPVLRNSDMAVLGRLIGRTGLPEDALGVSGFALGNLACSTSIPRLIQSGYVEAPRTNLFRPTPAGENAFHAWENEAVAYDAFSLTPMQRKAFDIIAEALARNGVAPSFDEMKDALGLRSKSGVDRLLKGLEERGWISRIPYHARAIAVRRAPERAAA